MLSLLEDTGYLARLSVLADTIAHRVGLHGYSVVPVVLGLGCKVPAIMATRLLETRREKVIATALLLMSAPCMSQTAMIIAIVSPCGGAYLLLVFLFIFAMGLLATLLLNRVMKGEVPELFITIPPYRLPNGRLLTQKLWLRLSSFVYEAIPAIFLGLTIIGILDMAGVIEILSHVLSPFFSFLGLPSDIAPVVVTGFLRKDVSIALLKSYMLSPEQLVIACVFLTLYLPCISTLFIMLRELRLKDTLLVTTLMLGSSFLAGALLRLVLATFQ
jgi:ferrous iron transport protein B